jgi:hypothetical protein
MRSKVMTCASQKHFKTRPITKAKNFSKYRSQAISSRLITITSRLLSTRTITISKV